ncbi:MAG: TIM barrel protein [Saprospiraceae bacterium]|nr:TIM barrel protein [Saprospiraceae bacterium]
MGTQDLARVFAQENLSCQQYTWFTFFRREKKEWVENLDHSFASLRRAGFQMFEPTFENVADVNAIRDLVAKHEISVKSFYVNSVLHDPADVSESMDLVVSIGEAARKLGAEIIVTNPSPIQWGGPENKSDKQLIHQAQSLEKLGKELKSIGLTLAYHNHDAEMREGAREFHHMLSTDPDYVSLCLDAHWIYRGSGNSSVALFDIINLYRDRIVELHLRQSKRGTWTETFGVGDIDYSRLAEDLSKHQMKPLVVMEQAVEEGTPHRLHSIEALSASRVNATYTFQNLLH